MERAVELIVTFTVGVIVGIFIKWDWDYSNKLDEKNK